jgi:signal transduction histidine kinase
MIKIFSVTILLAFIGNSGFPQLAGTDPQRDSLKHELAMAKDDTSHVLVMADIANAYFTNNFDSLYRYGSQALALAQRIQFSRGEIHALNALGLGYLFESDYPKSLQYFYRGLQIAEKKNDVFETAVCYSWIGEAYWFLADYSKSVDVSNQSQKLFETIAGEPGVRGWMSLNVLSIGQCYVDWNRLDSAYRYLSESYEATLHDMFVHPIALYNLGDCLFKRGNRDTAFTYVRESIAASIINGDYITQAEACAVMSRFFKIVQHPDSAIYYAKKGFAVASVMGYKLGVYKNSKLLAAEYEQLDVQEALYYRKIFDSVNEGIYGQKKVQELQKTLADEQQRQQQIQEQQIERESRLKQYGFMAGLGIMLLIAFILYRNNRQKQRTNQVLEKTLTDLKSTQAQLIQSEKMASLGELTAGIAHEIQNPLNFVNNFSEVNGELIGELVDEADKGNTEEVKAIANDIKENLEKISHHGKRADNIVKGMLQHSHAGSGQKELTDINKLADEYIRLSYHGLRARDKSFNAEIKTNFGENIEKINVVPQDIGRVILNVINNAFYAVNKKRKSADESYQPTVSVQTKKLNNKVEIRVTDNGNGIPQNIVDKIFQPFFTTKPTGQGTGLGLSLAYDIIKAHGGEIKVETKEGEGSAFVIQLPVNN